MSTPWYYDYYEHGALGRQVVPTTLTQILGDGTERNTKTTALTGEQANPLTIRLLGIRQPLNKLNRKVKQINNAIEKQARKQFNKGEIFEMKGEFITQGGLDKTSGAPIDRFTISEDGKTYEFRHIMAHVALYEFLTNWVSILDRLAYEINMLYDLRIDKFKLYWGNLTKELNLTNLEGKDKALTDLFKDYVKKLHKASRYRNRLVHDGIIRVSVDVGFAVHKGTKGLSIKLAQDPDNINSPMDVDAIEFCKKSKNDVLELLDRSYKLMLQHYQNHGNPPW